MESIERFLGYGDGDGYGYGDGNGNGNGNGNGYGDGNGNGYGYGYGNGYGNGDGNGNGNGNGNGYGDGNGNGYGYGYGNGNGYGDGYGYGNGNGYGDGDGDGNGNGYGNGYGNGDGNGYGYGNGYGDGDGISEYDGKRVYNIDNVPTIIENIKGDIAKGYTIRNNTRLVECFIAKCGGFFAHGETAKQAMLDARSKYEQNKPLTERIADTIKKYPTLDTLVPNEELYVLHNILTGSCAFGRNEFVRRHGIDVKNGSMTMKDFIDLTRNDYGGSAIVELEREYRQL